jgi:hypothetical protein
MYGNLTYLDVIILYERSSYLTLLLYVRVAYIQMCQCLFNTKNDLVQCIKDCLIISIYCLGIVIIPVCIGPHVTHTVPAYTLLVQLLFRKEGRRDLGTEGRNWESAQHFS